MSKHDPKTIVAIRLTKKSREYFFLFVFMLSMAGFFAAFAGVQFYVCKSNSPGISFIDCIKR